MQLHGGSVFTDLPVVNKQDMDSKITSEFLRLTDIIRQLRDPVSGCPWDKEQTHSSLKPYLIEEAYETLDAIDSGESGKLCEELGDVLLQVVLHAQVASDSGKKDFDISDICRVLSDKLIRRHPHIFADTHVKDSAEVKKNWEHIKQTENKGKKEKGALDGVPNSLPSLLRAARLGEKAARLGFDWQNVKDVKSKVIEELEEISAEEAGSAAEKEEFGDLLFSLAQWARHKKIDPEEALRFACQKFTGRFRKMEGIAGEDFGALTLDEKEKLWEKAKES